MSFDRPRTSDIPRVSAVDPLPAQPSPRGRWGEPYESGGLWRCSLRNARLSTVEKLNGLVAHLSATTREGLEELQRQQDDLWRRLRAAQCAACGR